MSPAAFGAWLDHAARGRGARLAYLVDPHGDNVELRVSDGAARALWTTGRLLVLRHELFDVRVLERTTYQAELARLDAVGLPAVLHFESEVGLDCSDGLDLELLL